jgi:hypothetical protein
MRLHAHDGTGGQGDVYQGRLKRFPVQDDEHFLLVCRYVKRNALRAGLVRRAEDGTWGSLNRWLEEPEREPRLLFAWPIARSPRWAERVNKPLTAAELKAVRTSVNRGAPLGDGNGVQAISRHLNLQSTLRPRGRPKKESCHLFPLVTYDGLPVRRCSQDGARRTRSPSYNGEEKVSGLFSGELSSEKMPSWEDQNVQTKRVGWITP